MIHSHSWISAVRKAGLAHVIFSWCVYKKRGLNLTLLNVKCFLPQAIWGKLPWKGTNEFRCDPNCYLSHAYSHCSKQKEGKRDEFHCTCWACGSAVSSLWFYTAQCLDRSKICWAAEVKKGALHWEHCFLLVLTFTCLKQCCRSLSCPFD